MYCIYKLAKIRPIIFESNLNFNLRDKIFDIIDKNQYEFQGHSFEKIRR